MTQERLAQRLGVSAMTVSRWERPNSQAQLNTSAMVAVAEALDIEPQDLWRHPDRPSADQLLRDASDLEARRAVAAIAAMLGKTGTDN